MKYPVPRTPGRPRELAFGVRVQRDTKDVLEQHFVVCQSVCLRLPPPSLCNDCGRSVLPLMEEGNEPRSGVPEEAPDGTAGTLTCPSV